MINCDAVVDNRAGTLWIDLEHIAEVDAVGRRLGELGLPVTALSERTKPASGLEPETPSLQVKCSAN